MIGKGGRSQEVIEAMQEHGAVYFAAVGGAAAYIAQSIKEVRLSLTLIWAQRLCTAW